MTFCSAACADRGPTASPEPAPEPVAVPAPAAPAARPVVPAAPPARPAAPTPAPAAPPAPVAAAPVVAAPVVAPVLLPTPGELDPSDLVDYRLSRPFRPRRAIIAIAGAIFAGGMALAIIEAVSPSTPSEVSAASADAPEAETPAAGAVSDQAAPAAAARAGERGALRADELHKAAIHELRALIDSPSSRIRRLAAMALARIADPQALDVLRELLASEPSALNRIEIAYALARAGDAAATQTLIQGLSAKRRDIRIDAAKGLVRLGNDRGRTQLYSMLGLSNHRIGAAGLLARLGDQTGVQALREVIASPKSSEEARMRATVALGSAGDASVRDQLVAILDDARYNVGAADALAAIGDPAARKPLERQLALNAMRVTAAVSLRRMKQAVDMAPLADALASGDEVARVSAAEAILILTGPEAVAERD